MTLDENILAACHWQCVIGDLAIDMNGLARGERETSAMDAGKSAITP